jgi:hypothetical protein
MRTVLVNALIGIGFALLVLWSLPYVLSMPDHVCDPRVTACE